MNGKIVRLVIGFALLGPALALGACDDVGAALGMARSSPDDGKPASTNPPLSLPPNYELKPPRETPKDAEADSGAPSTDPSIHHLQ